MLILCIGTKILLNLISPIVRVAHQEEHAMPGPEYRMH